MDFLIRKGAAAFFVTLIGSLIGAWFVYDFDGNVSGESLLTWTFGLSLYIGAVVFLYGTLASGLIELLHHRVRTLPSLVFILIHGLFGALSVLVVDSWSFGLIAFLFAVVYAAIDRLIFLRKMKRKMVAVICAVPLVLILVSVAGLELASPPEPAFEAEDAVERATSGQGTRTADFPNHIGTETGEEEGLVFERTTSVEKLGEETYLVTFTEEWSDDYDSGK
ncbi:hypothetical protein LCM20_08895 [Halobacillus litoralis]|uniref:hypothetical protein n=1 Tax=Halobacillus litoralis TaxID=45668 RepID=UPI001CD67BFD|nr:hypothetical protein [Halobacillus litoralis]MCA0970703.1 hypothetical protein [Halobacillus litoralis]